ncbi:MAG: hypothetical protein HY318_04350, partial [Armatimonadetes bacterium]|nr:hypothetical protein [Armatimonadota bacterium]
TANTSPDFALYSDGVLSIEENSFEFKVKPGRYAVTAVIGDLSPGEGRPGNSLWANGTQVASNEMTNATVKAFRFPVEAAEGRISLRFRADSLQKYVTVIAVTADPLVEGETCAPSVKELPEKLPTTETYRSNWSRYEDLLLADWEKAKAELKAEGVDFEFWRKESARLRQQKGYREYFGWGLGSWERLEERMGAISLQRICPVFTEMGVDGFLANSPIAIRELPKGGLKRAVAGHAEGFPQQDMTGITLNLMKKADGTTTTIPRVWSNCAPESLKAFQDLWRKTLTAGAPGASFFMIDEPRGMWYSGTIGDYSEPAQAAFKRWAAAHGWTDLAARGIPERGRTLDFYRFYQFRLESVAMFVKSSLKGTPVEKVPTAPGNGNVGPEQMNHNSYWPPAMVRHGLIAASWAYDSPASCKMYAETLRMAEEAGGQSCIVPPLYAEMHTPIQEVPMTTACVSALNTRVCPWHFSGPLNGPNRSQWMKSVYYGSRLAHATTGLAHTPAVYVWCPESIVYNDLVDFNQAEAGNWRKVWQTLFDANIDFGVTNLIAIPKGTVLLYACVRPVLNGEEFSRLRRFVETGGTVLCAFTGPPESPDGARIPNWDALPKDRVIRVELDPRRLKEAVTSRTRGGNWVAVNPSVKTYFYNRNGARVHLLNNTDHTVPATEIAPNGVKDLLTGKEIQQGSPVAILPGGYALVEERR